MTQELRLRNQSQQLYVRALSQAWRNNVQLYDPSIWLNRDPDVEEKMLRDADIAHAVTARMHMIAGNQWMLVPKNDASPRAELAVAVGTELLSGIQHFTDARLNLARAFFSGSRFGRIHATAKKSPFPDGRERTWWRPFRVEDMDKRMYRVVPDMEGAELAGSHWEMWDIGAQEWKPQSMEDAAITIRHIYQESQAKLHHGTALREALGWWWYAKEHVFQESLQAIERFAQGIISAKVDGIRDAATGKPNSQLISDWKDVLEDLRSRHVLVYDSADQVEMVQMNGDGWQLLKDIREELSNTITRLVLGSNLPTNATEGGSYALAEVQENTTETLIQYDRESLEETLSDDLLGAIWFRNHANLAELGIENERPRFTITQEKRQDPAQRAAVFETLNRFGVTLALDEVHEQTGTRKPEDGEDVVSAVGQFSFDPAAMDTTDSPDLAPVAMEVQDTALNGAQVQAAAEIIDRVVNNAMPPGTATRMLVSMFNLPPAEAQAMIQEAVAFQPAAPPAAPPVPNAVP